MDKIFIPYLFAKDLRRMAPFLAVWCLIIVVGELIPVVLWKWALIFCFFQAALQYVLLLILVPLIITDEPVVGTSAFWLTRPMSRQGILFTKICFIGMFFVIFPLLAALTVLAVAHISLPLILLSIPEIVLEAGAAVLPVVLLASVVQDLNGYIRVIFVWICVTTTVGIVGMVLMSFFMLSHLGGHPYVQPLSVESYRNSELILIQVISIIFFGGLIAHQYLTRKTTLSIGLMIIGSILLTITPFFWGVDFLKPRPLMTVPLKAENVQVGFEFSGANTYGRPWSPYASDDQIIRSRVRISGLPAGYAALAEKKGNIHMWYPDGTKIISGRVNFQTPMASVENDPSLIRPLQEALGNDIFFDPFNSGLAHNEIFHLPWNAMASYVNVPGTYSVDLALHVYQFKVTVAVPLKPGQGDFQRSQQTIITQIVEQPQGLNVSIVDRHIHMLFDRREYNDHALPYGQYSIAPVYLLRNSKRKQTILGYQFIDLSKPPTVDFFASLLNARGRIQTSAETLHFNFSHLGFAVDDDWLKDAQLVRVEAIAQGAVNKPLRIENFILSGKDARIRPFYSTFNVKEQLKLRAFARGLWQRRILPPKHD